MTDHQQAVPQPPRQNGHAWKGSQWVPDAPMGYVTNPAIVIIAWIVALVTLGYMLPWAVAASRSMPNHGAIFVLNLLLGWTVIGWIIALIMACSQKRR